MDERRVYHGERIGEGNFEAYGHYTQVCVKGSGSDGPIEGIWKADGDARSFGPRRRMWVSRWLRRGPEPILLLDDTPGRAIIRASALTRVVDVLGVGLEASDGNV